MSKKELLAVIRESLAEDRRKPEEAFQRMVRDGLIDADGRPLPRERKLVFSDRGPEPDDRGQIR